MDIMKATGLGIIGFIEVFELFEGEGPEVDFFRNEIEVKGLQDFHISIKSGLSDDSKRDIVRETIRAWDMGTPITSL